MSFMDLMPDDPVTAALIAGSNTRTTRAEIWRSGQVAATTESTEDELRIVSGNINIAYNNAIRRTLDIVLEGTGLVTVIDMFKDHSSLLSMEIFVHMGIWSALGGDEHPVGVFVPDEVVHEESSSAYRVSVRCGDRSILVSDAQRTAPYSISSGTDAVEAFTDFMNFHYNGVQLDIYEDVEGETPDLVFDYENEDPWADARKLAESFGAECYFNREGYCVLRMIADPVTAELFGTYSDTDPDAYPIIGAPISRRIDVRKIYNGVIVRGEAPWLLFPVVGQKWDTDPMSPTYYDPEYPELSPVGPHPLIVTDSYVGTTEAAQALAEGKFNQVRSFDEEVSLSIQADPRLGPGSPIQVSSSLIDLEGRVVVDSASLPFSAGEVMNIRGRRVS